MHLSRVTCYCGKERSHLLLKWHKVAQPDLKCNEPAVGMKCNNACLPGSWIKQCICMKRQQLCPWISCSSPPVPSFQVCFWPSASTEQFSKHQVFKNYCPLTGTQTSHVCLHKKKFLLSDRCLSSEKWASSQLLKQKINNQTLAFPELVCTVYCALLAY